MTAEQLQKEWENYTRQIAAGATGTATSVLLMPYTAGISLVGLGVSAPRIHNARKKREIIEAGLQARGASPHTRKRDVVTAMGVSGAVSGLTLGIVAPGGDAAIGAVVQHTVEWTASQAALDGAGAALVTTTDQIGRSKGSGSSTTQLPLTHSNLEGLGTSQHKPRPPSHACSFDSVSTDTTKTGPLSTPYIDDESVLFHPILEEHTYQQAFAEPHTYHGLSDPSTNDATNMTVAQQEVWHKMQFLQLEMQKRRSNGQADAFGHEQVLSQEGWYSHSMQNITQGLGIMGVGQPSSNPRPSLQMSNCPTTYDQPPTPGRPYPNQRSESLPAKLDSQPHSSPNGNQQYYNYEPVPSYQQAYPPPPQQLRPHLPYQPQHISAMLPLPSIQQERQDSGYYSASSTPSFTDSASRPNPPQQYILSTQVSSPQPMTSSPLTRHSVTATSELDYGLHRHNHVMKKHRHSESTVSSTSTQAPDLPPRDPASHPPPPYTQPNITITPQSDEQCTRDLELKDYFNSQDTAAVRLLAKRKSQALLKGVNQGWQWAKAFPIADSKLKHEVERDYGPPPEIPVAWASR